MRPRDVTAPLASNLMGDEPCSDRGCVRIDGVDCEYVDDVGEACASAWCADHVAVIDGSVYCLRHAGTIRALQGSTTRPEVHNRGPSLVYVIGRQLDVEMRNYLNEIRDGLEEAIVTRSVRPMPLGRATIWRSDWSLRGVDTALVVSVEVAEGTPTEVTLRVDGKTALTLIPPWIEARSLTQQPSRAEDLESRRRFHDALMSATREAVATGRP